MGWIQLDPCLAELVIHRAVVFSIVDDTVDQLWLEFAVKCECCLKYL